MKVAITSQGRELDSNLDERFGRCACFIVADSETEDFEVLENQGASASGGAGVQAAQMIGDSQCDALITGHLGPNAVRALQQAGILVYSASSCTVRQALGKLKNGELGSISGATVGPHFGMNK